MEFEPVIGLEIHTELKTKTKMFCGCLNDPEEKTPNKNVCPVCLGHPGTLPTINRQAVEQVVKVGLALHSEIPEYSKFDRKNYFYPDLPKGYQISQYDMPLCRGGELSLFLSNDAEEAEKKVIITRVHLEEDTGKLVHPADKLSTLIDFNRAGVPLMELVTEPVMHNGQEARLFAQGLQMLFRALGISEADMEKGQMRCEVNISLRPVGNGADNKLGTKVEIKNLNSFRAVERSIDFEIKRQKEVLEKGEKVTQETRGWDAEKEITYSQRLKEEAQDYRYFPDPDLPKLRVHAQEKKEGLLDLDNLKKQMPELPWEKKERVIKSYAFLVDINSLMQDEQLMSFFEETARELEKTLPDQKEKSILLAYNYLTSDLKGLLEADGAQREELKITPQSFAQLIKLLLNESISSRAGKDVLAEMVKNGGQPDDIIQSRHLGRISDVDALDTVAQEIVQGNSQVVADYKKGKENALQFLVGQAMAKTRGAADPKLLEQSFKKILNGN